jgi:hypothetical protein
MSRNEDAPVEVRGGPAEGSYRRPRKGRRVEVVPGVTAFEHIDFSAGLHASYEVEGRLALDDPPSRYLLDSFTVRRQAGIPYETADMPVEAQRRRAEWFSAQARPVTAEGIRAVPVEAVTSSVLRLFGAESTFDNVEAEQAAALRRAGMGDEAALHYVAGVYLAESLRGGAPAAAVAHQFDCSPATASRWVAAAKDAGYLQVADRRRR